MALALIAVLAARHWPGAMDLWIATGIVIFIFCPWDIRVLLREPPPAVVRGLFTSQPVGVWRIVRLCATNPASRLLRLTLYDHHPSASRTEGLPMRLYIPPGGEGGADYRIVFEARGEHVFSQVDPLVPGPLRLFPRRPPVSQRPPPDPRGLATSRGRGPRRRATSLTGGPRQPLSRHQAQRGFVTAGPVHCSRVGAPACSPGHRPSRRYSPFEYLAIVSYHM
jgi:uncharacterized protein (DUF58 family)